jgi:REP element-mobilizing transposase RayT
MPARNLTFKPNYLYHIYNRGFLKIPIFKTDSDCKKFCDKLNTYSAKFKINICSYALMENHFHFLISQKKDGNVKNFMRILQQSYATYFNIKYHRKGALFEGRFKANPIDKITYFTEMQKYIANNPIKALKNMPYETLIRSSLLKPGHHYPRN